MGLRDLFCLFCSFPFRRTGKAMAIKLEGTYKARCYLLAQQNLTLKREIRELRAELERLQGQLTEEERKQDADDEMVFAIVRGDIHGYEGDRIVIEIGK